MDKNNNPENNNHQNNLDEYISREISNYYGQDVMNSVNSTAPTPLPKRFKRRTRMLYSAVSVICAVVFLTGVIIFSGVFFSSGVPTASVDNTPDTASSDASSKQEMDFETTDTENVHSDADINSNYSSNDESSKAIESDPETYSENTSSNDKKDESYNTNSEKGTSSNDTISYFDNNSAETSGAIAQNSSSNTAETIDSPSRPHYYSLPEIPDEGTVTSIHTDLDNNTSTNPYDNVTTGRRVRAGIGITLMTMSLSVSLVLNKLKIKEEV